MSIWCDDVLLEVARLQRAAVVNRHSRSPVSQYAVAVLRVLIDAGHASLAESLGQDSVEFINRWERLGLSPARCAARIIRRESK